MSESGPPGGSAPEQCRDCGSFMKWVDKSDEIQEAHDEALEKGIDPVENGVPPGAWGYWTCPRCDGRVLSDAGGSDE